VRATIIEGNVPSKNNQQKTSYTTRKDVALENNKTHPTAFILVSACLLGEPTRFDQGSVKCDHFILDEWLQEGKIISFCPEVEGGCPTPRPPAEIMSGDGDSVVDGEVKVINVNGQDVTKKFMLGAQKALQLAQRKGVNIALLKARSPSCGNHFIYDGTFSNTLKKGKGVTAALLEREGIRVFNEEEIEEAEELLHRLASTTP
jgi:uncharacterized protein YbbK (DUF523 family)